MGRRGQAPPPGVGYRHGRGRPGDPGRRRRRRRASWLQRIGRAGHQVGDSVGVLFPNHRTDSIDCAVTVRRMQPARSKPWRCRPIRSTSWAQHTAAAAALEPLDADARFDTVRRSARSRRCRAAFEATLTRCPASTVHRGIRRAAPAWCVRLGSRQPHRAARCAAIGHFRRVDT